MKRRLLYTILSISLLTVMAGAAIAPALGVISAHFAGRNPLLIQLIVSLPALLSAALYLGQFLSSLIVSPSARLMHSSPYFVGVGVSIICLVQAILTRKQQMLPRI